MARNNCCLITYIVFIVIFFIIGITCYLTGCHDDIQPNCIRFHKLKVMTYDHYTLARTCSECIAYRTICNGGRNNNNCHSSCVQYRYYTCYDSYAKFHFEKDGQRTCEVKAASGYVNEFGALSYAQNYYQDGRTYGMYIDKSHYGCSTVGSVESTAIAGFVFLLFTAIMLIILFFCWFCNRKNSRPENNDKNLDIEVGTVPQQNYQENEINIAQNNNINVDNQMMLHRREQRQQWSVGQSQ